MTKAEYLRAAKDWDPHTLAPKRTLEERQQAKEYFLSDMLDTDDATQAQIDKDIDEMLERIYSARSWVNTGDHTGEGSDAA
jgi:hypothetical protein